jgi:hypothetical protein
MRVALVDLMSETQRRGGAWEADGHSARTAIAITWFTSEAPTMDELRPKLEAAGFVLVHSHEFWRRYEILERRAGRHPYR